MIVTQLQAKRDWLFLILPSATYWWFDPVTKQLVELKQLRGWRP